MEIKWGLVPDMGGMLLMRELARADVVRELTFSGRISGQETLTTGFATRLSADPLRLAHDIASKSPDAIRAGKRLLNAAMSIGAAELLLAESAEQKALMAVPTRPRRCAPMSRGAPVFLDPG